MAALSLSRPTSIVPPFTTFPRAPRSRRLPFSHPERILSATLRHSNGSAETDLWSTVEDRFQLDRAALHRCRNTGGQRESGEHTQGQNPSAAVAIRRSANSHTNDASKPGEWPLRLPLLHHPFTH
ncbi:hypothetical protein OROHE_023024 [Orobanche hederae]